ncbi:HNH endonuclease [Burkholderia sp. Ac-20345]|uniref:HNH endonuclease n=1 Tax=Burkholderia sp. Ac-20345 TaxID=2703891 RepID=UPI00197C703C|nr:HNH endonuclease signature motif containing protein [Burkholderia sp. Ac-20345]MBN3777259.1 HNH endonuclease [Burkholderia sp. Ac-20345]
MFAIPKPEFPPNLVFDMCVESIANEDLKRRLRAVALNIKHIGNFYHYMASEGMLHDVKPARQTRDTEVIIGQVTRGELRSLYKAQMVQKNKAAREIYDQLCAAADDEKCPTCGVSVVSTIDHFLPKSTFPWFSVLPENLVPACRECNSEKLAKAADDGQSFHPYYDIAPLMREQWLFAEIDRTSPLSARYFVRPPQHWGALSVRRAENHFRDYGLGSKFAKHAGAELTELANTFRDPPMTPAEIRDALGRRLRAVRKSRCNSWKVALLQALLNCHWFCALEF